MTWKIPGDLTEYFISFAIGVRFAPNYGLGDHLGRIFDDILNSGNEFFSRDVFAYNQRAIDYGVLEDKIPDRLANIKPSKALTIEPRNIVLDYTPTDISEVPSIVDGFYELVLERLMRKYKVKGIARIGYINRYEIESDEAVRMLMDRTVGNTEEVSDLYLRFTRRCPSEESIIYKGIQNYQNLIYNLTKAVDRESLRLSLDYQLHFDPPLKDARDIPFGRFVGDVLSHNLTRLPKWFNEYCGGEA